MQSMASRGQGEGTISPMKDGLYCGRLTVGYDANGKQKRKAFYGKTKKEVQDKMNQAKVNLSNNSYLEPSRMLLGDWLDQWLVEYKQRTIRPSSYYSLYYRPANYHIKPALGNVKLKDLTDTMVQNLINALADKGLKRGTISKSIECLRASLYQAIANDLIQCNAAKNVVLPQESVEERRVLTPDEQARFISVAGMYPYGNLYILMLATGARLGEARSLTWGDVDFEKCELSINKTFSVYNNMEERKKYRVVNPPKTNAGKRTIPLLSGILERLVILRANAILCGEEDLIFTDDGILPCEETVRLRFKRILREAGIEAEGLHLHSLRHTFATRGLENGIELKVMQELLGHASINETADTYTHVLPDKKMDSIIKLADTIHL